MINAITNLELRFKQDNWLCPILKKCAGGLFGRIGVTVRTVGGGESWTSDIVPNTDNTTADTIAQILGQRERSRVATGGVDYEVLDTTVMFQVCTATL